MSFELRKLGSFNRRKGPLLLIIMDGVGIGKRDESDGVYMAKTPCLDTLFKSKLFTVLKAHGTAVGMPSDDDMGNSEVGHNALGAGRIFSQGAKLVNESVKSGKIFETDIWKKLIGRVNKNKKTFHFIGLLSDGNVHSHIDQLFALIRDCVKKEVKRVRIHTLLDGRDVYEKSSLTYIDRLEDLLADINKESGYDYHIASGGGRMVTTMDRYNADWTVVKRGWDAHVLGKARAFSSAKEAINTYYEEDEKITDQYMDSFVITENDKPVGTIEDGDSVVFFNFRGDRAIELSRAFEEEDFREFDRERRPDVSYAGMMQYDGDLSIPKQFLVFPPAIDRSVSEYICANGIPSFALSETQKFGHVTYFWNGNNSGYVNEALEEFIEIPSDKLQFDKAPRMKAYEITEKTIELLKSGRFKFGRINLANGDMVGHTGVESAIITAMEAVDECLSKLINAVNDLEGITMILADHGNSDEMFEINKKGQKVVKTAHTLNPIPFVIVDSGYKSEYQMASFEKRGLSNVAATILNLLGFESPDGYDPSLISFNT